MVVVGDRKVIEPGIRALNLGPVRVMTVDEVIAMSVTSTPGAARTTRITSGRSGARGWRPIRARLAMPFQSGGRFPTVGSLLDHVFLVERRHLSRLEGHAAGLDRRAPGDVKALFEYADLVRADFRRFVTTSTTPRRRADHVHAARRPDDHDERRKLATHIVLHEMRHLAQIAYAARVAGHEPPGEHDYFFAPIDIAEGCK